MRLEQIKVENLTAFLYFFEIFELFELFQLFNVKTVNPTTRLRSTTTRRLAEQA